MAPKEGRGGKTTPVEPGMMVGASGAPLGSTLAIFCGASSSAKGNHQIQLNTRKINCLRWSNSKQRNLNKYPKLAKNF